jgi:hypothetical protein
MMPLSWASASDRSPELPIAVASALGLLERDQDGRYANTTETNLYLDRHKPTYVGGLLETLIPERPRILRNKIADLSTRSLVDSFSTLQQGRDKQTRDITPHGEAAA